VAQKILLIKTIGKTFPIPFQLVILEEDLLDVGEKAF
jgi:hypothetical protein